MTRGTLFTSPTVAALLVVAGCVLALPAVAQDIRDADDPLAAVLSADGLTRAQLASLYQALTLAQFQPPACVAGSEMFTDVPATSSFCPWIEELARRGITTGCTATQYCPGSPVSRAQMAVFVVRATADEAFHVVGAPGEPEFGNGGEGDCLWHNMPLEFGFNAVSFFKDSDGIVHLAGLPAPLDGPGGDMTCDDNDLSDNVIFQLPAGYQPERIETFLGATGMQNLIAPVGGMTVGELFIPGGSVVTARAENGRMTTLDGFTFRAAAATPSSFSREAVHIPLQTLRDLLD